MNLIRVRYGEPSTPVADREYQIDGKGPVGTIAEFQKHFPKENLLIFEGDELMNIIKVKK